MIEPYEIGLDYSDFKIEIICISDDLFDILTFTPTQIVRTKVNGVEFDIRTRVDRVLMESLGKMNKCKYEIDWVDVVRIDAVLKFLNRKNYVRKRKINKILK